MRKNSGKQAGIQLHCFFWVIQSHKDGKAQEIKYGLKIILHLVHIISVLVVIALKMYCGVLKMEKCKISIQNSQF